MPTAADLRTRARAWNRTRVPAPDEHTPATPAPPAPQRPVRPLRPGPRGWLGRGRGEDVHVEAPDEFRATTMQACGLWPWVVGSSAPMIGVPLGRHMETWATVCCDPISWFQRANLIANPSVFVLGQPALGKSTLVRRMATGLAAAGVIPLSPGDLKPDYVDLFLALRGQVERFGRGSFWNILDPGEAKAAAVRLTGADRDALLADAHSRRLTMVSALLTILRSTPPTDREETIIDRALHVLDERHQGVPVLADLLQVIRDAPQDVRAVALDRGSHSRYQEITENLEVSLLSLATGGRLGDLFSRPTTNPMRRDRPVVIDISGISGGANSDAMQAAALLASWSTTFGMINVSNALADAGLEPRRHYFVIMDELWKVLRAGRGMVDRVDALTRLNRQVGVGMAMISHTMADLMALPTEEDRMKARGFVERAGMVICAGLPSAEMPMLTQAVPMSQAEQDMVTSWQTPANWSAHEGRAMPRPGLGKFLIKVGGRPGIPVQMHLTPTEAGVHDTNRLWHQRSRTGRITNLEG